MSVCLIPCTQDCAYQKDGFCSLEFPLPVSDPSGQGCVYHRQLQTARQTITLPQPQTPPEHSLRQ